MSKVIVGITYENFSKMITAFIDDLLGALFLKPFSNPFQNISRKL